MGRGGGEFVGGKEPAFCFGAAGAIDPEGGVGGWWGGRGRGERWRGCGRGERSGGVGGGGGGGGSVGGAG